MPTSAYAYPLVDLPGKPLTCEHCGRMFRFKSVYALPASVRLRYHRVHAHGVEAPDTTPPDWLMAEAAAPYDVTRSLYG